MSSGPMPRLSSAAREAIIHRLASWSKSAPVPISRILHDIRSDTPNLRESDEELIQQIVMDATDSGFAVHFDRDGEQP